MAQYPPCTYRVLPPPRGDSFTNTIGDGVLGLTLSANYYNAPAGQAADVQQMDFAVAINRGWTVIAASGPTSSRALAFNPYPGTAAYAAAGPLGMVPAAAQTPGTLYFDSTIGALIVWDGAAWRLPTGAAA